MEMEDHHHHQYGMPDLRQLLNGPTLFQAIPQGPELFSSGNLHLLPPQLPQQQHHNHHFDMMQTVGRQVGHELMPRGLHHELPSDATANNATPTAAFAVTSASPPSASCGFDGEGTAFGGDGGTGRWPRQETLTLLEIRSRLDPKFKEANQKGPLWDQVSRIMSEEHGYQRSGKKCREKFENLYKYYKKTKEGKAGRQDGKTYRFFRQLEALYGETSNAVSVQENHLVANNFRFHGTPNSNSLANQEVYHTQKLCESLSLSNSSEFDTSSSDVNDLSTAVAMETDSLEKRKKRRSSSRSWKAKIKEFIDLQMRNLVERQEAWLEKLTKTLEQKEQERVLREEEWRKEEAARIDREHKFWAKERVWTEARDAALVEALQNLTGKQLKSKSSEELIMATEMQNRRENQNENGSETTSNTDNADGWQESEISRLMQLRTSMESRFEQGGCSEEILWEEIAAKMACLGFDRSALMCKDKWDRIGAYLMKTKDSNKKRKENSRACGYNYQNKESIYSQGRTYCKIIKQGLETVRLQANNGSSPSNSNAGNAVSDSCFRFLTADHGENLWDNYGLNLSK